MRFKFDPKNLLLLLLVLTISIVAVNLSMAENCEEETTTNGDQANHEYQLQEIRQRQVELSARLAEVQFLLAGGEGSDRINLPDALDSARNNAGLTGQSGLESVVDICFRPDPALWRITLLREGQPITIVIDAVTGSVLP